MPAERQDAPEARPVYRDGPRRQMQKEKAGQAEGEAPTTGLASSWRVASTLFLAYKQRLRQCEKIFRVAGWNAVYAGRRCSWVDDTARRYRLDPRAFLSSSPPASNFHAEKRSIAWRTSAAVTLSSGSVRSSASCRSSIRCAWCPGPGSAGATTRTRPKRRGRESAPDRP